MHEVGGLDPAERLRFIMGSGLSATHQPYKRKQAFLESHTLPAYSPSPLMILSNSETISG